MVKPTFLLWILFVASLSVMGWCIYSVVKTKQLEARAAAIEEKIRQHDSIFDVEMQAHNKAYAQRTAKLIRQRDSLIKVMQDSIR